MLKVAKNRKGLAQNEYEASILSDHYVMPLGLTIPMIDYDEQHNQPLWIHTEKASKVTLTQFKKYFGGLTPAELVQFAYCMSGKKRYSPETKAKFEQIYETNEPAQDFVDLIGGFDIEANDFSSKANWGIYDGRVVIIDVGGSTEIIKKYYT